MARVRAPSIDVRRSADRFVTRTDWLDSRHSFSHGAHYDPENTHFGLLVAHNADVVGAGRGFDPHPHRDVEIVTWVLRGTLAHDDSAGHRGRARPGLVQRLTAGSGVRHSEYATADADVHLVQMWVLPQEGGVQPGYAQRDMTVELARGRLVVVASGMPRHADPRHAGEQHAGEQHAREQHDGALTIRQPSAALHAARLPAAAVETLPSAPFVHVYVAHGSVQIGEVPTRNMLERGDAARISGSDGLRMTAGPAGSEVLVWEMHSGPEFASEGGFDGRPTR